MKKFNYKLEIDIFRNSTQICLGVMRGSFKGFGCPKRHPDALLAKTMMLICCLHSRWRAHWKRRSLLATGNSWWMAAQRRTNKGSETYSTNSACCYRGRRYQRRRTNLRTSRKRRKIAFKMQDFSRCRSQLAWYVLLSTVSSEREREDGGGLRLWNRMLKLEC